jgi:hypothetical protein
MRPVPPWLAMVAPPYRGEVHTDFWGPLTVYINEFDAEGYLLLTNYRLIFVRSYGPDVPYMAVQFDLPLGNIFHVTPQFSGDELYLGVNHLVFHGIAPPGQYAWHTAEEMRSAIVQMRLQRVAELQRAAAPLPSSISPPIPPGPPGPHPSPTVPPAVGPPAPGSAAVAHLVPCAQCGHAIDAAATRCPSCGVARTP